MDSFVFISPNGIESCLAELAGDLYMVRHTQNVLKKTYDDLKIWVFEKNGKVVYEWGAEFAVSLNQDTVQEFLDLVYKHENTDIFNFCAGVGQTFSESCKACNFAEMSKGETVRYYSPDFELDLVSHDLDPLLKDEQKEEKHGLSVPGLSLEEDQEKPQEASPKQKIVEALMNVKKVAPQLAQLQQQAPDIYEAVKGIVDAMISMAQGV